MYGMASIVGGAVGVAGNVASSGATVGTAAGQTGAGSDALAAMTQRAQNTLASAAAASGPQAETDAWRQPQAWKKRYPIA
ncbi:MAG: hypothetical protein QOF74_2437 [Caballeronia mineralivorans]|jgi:hypothetical protein|nr:hypothetical protein [Caballeronia mineralivorans]